ncbi:nuclear hormone receptor family member nhr-100-like [Centruroides vittatus]|uniref:nuclear hormone receptor family member nhr-100-like n=1 Tax=Centruroides vittatus TaxID=120091 RepID=UPI003510C9FC
MTTKEQIEEFRLERSVFLNSLCVICGSQYWTSYYGNFGCKRCLRFFLRSITERKTYKCRNNSGNCQNVYFASIICKFCYLERMYRYGFMPARFGRHDDGWYMKDKIPSLRPVPAIDLSELRFLPDLESFVRCQRDYIGFMSYFTQLTMDMASQLNENPHDHLQFNIDTEVPDSVCESTKAAYVKLVRDSSHLHDVLKLGFKYGDPYQFRNKFVQNFSLFILNKARNKDENDIDNADNCVLCINFKV